MQVQQGTIIVNVGDQSVTLIAGDAVAFCGDMAHSYTNPGIQPARFSLAVFEPGVGSGSRSEGPVPDLGMLQEFLAGGYVDAAVSALRPDYRVMLLAVDGLVPGPSDQVSDELLRAAEAAAGELLRDRAVDQLPHVAAWREAYRAFGAKPQRTRNSLEALLRRAASGLPRVNRLTDLYNAVSVLHQVPLGGEDLTCYTGAPRLVRATGTEPFDTVADGSPVIEHPDPGEVVWCDDAGVTCRRWNWRQARRTQLGDHTTTALFILDALDPVTDEALHTVAEDLVSRLTLLGPDVRDARRRIAASTAPEGS
jgi:DNA/RNA-binding domain of Phe-tRNA-synthetase-like protein